MNRDNWTRAELKSRAKVSFKRNYWMCVAAALIIAVFTGAFASAGSNFGSQLAEETSDNYGNYEYYYDDDSDADIDSDYDEIWGDDDVVWDDQTSGSDALVYGAVFAVILIFVLIAVAIGSAVTIFVGNPLVVGCRYFFYRNDKEKAKLDYVGRGFKVNYLSIVKTLFFMDLKIIAWSLLLIIPGIIKTYEYKMIPYIVADNPDISTKEAFAQSRSMMEGQKWNAFVLDLSFILWDLLAGITLGIAGIFYVFPYIAQTDANLYAVLKGDYEANNLYDDNNDYSADYDVEYKSESEAVDFTVE